MKKGKEITGHNPSITTRKITKRSMIMLKNVIALGNTWLFNER